MPKARVRNQIAACVAALLMSLASVVDAREIYGIDEMADLPIKGMKAISSNGEIMFISDDGRFVIKGELYDMWYRSRHTTMDEIRRLDDRIDVGRIGIDYSELVTTTIGQGRSEVLVFVDPLCGYCHQVIESALNLVNDYTFRVIFTGILGQPSLALTARIACAKNTSEVIPAFLTRDLANISVKPSCDRDPVIQTETMAKVLNIRTVPTIIAADGRVSKTVPRDLGVWLSGSSLQ